MSDFFGNDDNDAKRTLSFRDKEIIHKNAHFKCQNCGKHVEFVEMQVGHKTAWSRGGRTTLKNSVCLCFSCNRLQGTDSWATFQKKQGKEVVSKDDPRKTELIHILQPLKIGQLKELCDKLNVDRPKAKDVGGYFTEMKAPNKSAYLRKIIKSNADIEKIKALILDFK